MQSGKESSKRLKIPMQTYWHYLCILHVLRRWCGIRGRLWWWLKAGLAAKAAGIATETMDVGPSGVVGYSPCLRIERVLLIYVIILFVPGWKWYTHTQQKKTETTRVHALTLSRRALRAVCNGIRGLLGADLLPINVHTRKVAHSMAESAQADSRENKER